MNFVPHRRQFVIAGSPIDLEDWLHLDIGDGLTLSYHRDIGVLEDEGKIILGQPLADGLSGRFVTIEGGRLRPDASALLGVYYGQADGAPFATSSPALARRLSGRPRDTRQLERRYPSMNWFPLPGSPTPGVSRLFRDQELVLTTGVVQENPRPIRAIDGREKAKTVLAETLTEVIRSLPDRTLHLALTAGLDSRLLLAATRQSGRPFEAYTQVVGEASLTDIDVAKRLAVTYGFRHRAIHPGRDQGIAADLSSHSDDAFADTDNMQLIPRGQYDFLSEGDIVIRGGCFEIGRRFYHGLLDTGEALSPDGILSAFEADRDADRSAFRDISAWLDWRSHHSDGLDLIDAFYLDQRVAGWLASIEQGLDALPFLSVQPANSETVFAALLGTDDPAERRSGHIQRITAEYLQPGILDVPINPKTAPSPGQRLARLGRRGVGAALRRLGLR